MAQQNFYRSLKKEKNKKQAFKHSRSVITKYMAFILKLVEVPPTKYLMSISDDKPLKIMRDSLPKNLSHMKKKS